MTNHEQFLLDRTQKGRGISDIAAIMVLSSCKTLLGVYLDKFSGISFDHANKNLKRRKSFKVIV